MGELIGRNALNGRDYWTAGKSIQRPVDSTRPGGKSTAGLTHLLCSLGLTVFLKGLLNTQMNFIFHILGNL